MSITEVQANPMARTKRASEENPPTVPVKLDRAVASKAKIVASDLGIDLAKYVSDALRPIVDRDWSKIVKRIDSSDGESK